VQSKLHFHVPLQTQFLVRHSSSKAKNRHLRAAKTIANFQRLHFEVDSVVFVESPEVEVVLIGVLSDFHHCVEYFIPASLHSNLDLLLQFFDLVQGIVELHLQVVALKQY